MKVLRISLTTGAGLVQDNDGIVAVAIAPSSMVGVVIVGGRTVRAGGVMWMDGAAPQLPVTPTHTFWRNSLAHGLTWSVDLMVWTTRDLRNGFFPTSPGGRASIHVERRNVDVAPSPNYTEVLRLPFVHRATAHLWMTPTTDFGPTYTIKVYGSRMLTQGLTTNDCAVRQLGEYAFTHTAAPTFDLGSFTNALYESPAVVIGGTDSAEAYDMLHVYAHGGASGQAHFRAEVVGDMVGGI